MEKNTTAYMSACTQRLFQRIREDFPSIMEENKKGGKEMVDFPFGEETPQELYGETLRIKIVLSLFYMDDGSIDISLQVDRPSLGYAAKRLVACHQPDVIWEKLNSLSFQNEMSGIFEHLRDEILYRP